MVMKKVREVSLFAQPVMARASKGLSNQQSRAAESILPAAPNVLAKAKLESHRQAVSNPQSLSPMGPGRVKTLCLL